MIKQSTLVFATLLVAACGDGDNAGMAGGGGSSAAAGDFGNAGVVTSGSGSGGAGTGAGSGQAGSLASSGSGGGTGEDPVMVSAAGCPRQSAPCNGFCLEVGQRAGDCMRLTGQRGAISLRSDAALVAVGGELSRHDIASRESTPIATDLPAEWMLERDGRLFVGNGPKVSVHDLASGSTTTLHEVTDALNEALRPALHGDHLYFAEQPYTTGGDGPLMRIPLGGGTAEKLIDRVGGYVLTGQQIYYLGPSPAIGADQLYVAELSAPGAGVMVAGVEISAWDFTIHQDALYYREPSGLVRWPISGGTSETSVRGVQRQVGTAEGVAFFTGFLPTERPQVPENPSGLLRVELGASPTAEAVFVGAGQVEWAGETGRTLFLSTSAGVFRIDR